MLGESTVLARHAGIDEATGQLAPDPDGGPRQLVISSDFYPVGSGLTRVSYRMAAAVQGSTTSQHS